MKKKKKWIPPKIKEIEMDEEINAAACGKAGGPCMGS